MLHNTQHNPRLHDCIIADAVVSGWGGCACTHQPSSSQAQWAMPTSQHNARETSDIQVQLGQCLIVGITLTHNVYHLQTVSPAPDPHKLEAPALAAPQQTSAPCQPAGMPLMAQQGPSTPNQRERAKERLQPVHNQYAEQTAHTAHAGASHLHLHSQQTAPQKLHCKSWPPLPADCSWCTVIRVVPGQLLNPSAALQLTAVCYCKPLRRLQLQTTRASGHRHTHPHTPGATVPRKTLHQEKGLS